MIQQRPAHVQHVFAQKSLYRNCQVAAYLALEQFALSLEVRILSVVDDTFEAQEVVVRQGVRHLILAYDGEQLRAVETADDDVRVRNLDLDLR